MPQTLTIVARRCFLLIFMLGFFASTASARDLVKKYIRKHRSLTEKLSEEYGIPVSVITAIAIVESGAGASKNCKLLNNHFGIIGKNNLRKTKGIKSKFKQYEDEEASYRDFCEMVKRKKYYQKLKGNVNYEPWLTAMARAGYSTQPATWKKMITSAIKKYKLDAANN
jgi:Bax protein